jgi:imidazole glycerol-phosphate synthase subunit HisH
MITIVDYGMGNLASVSNAVKRYAENVSITNKPEDIKAADKLILPGVGAFKDAYDEIEKRGLQGAISDFIESGRPFLGICLGLQLLFTRSYEDGEHRGFDIIKGDVVPFLASAGLKIPHMGWNNISQKETPRQARGTEGKTQNCQLFESIPDRAPMYFVHSYYVVPKDKSVITATTDYGINFCSMIHKDNIYAMQFHPEKSQLHGLKIIENFVRL